MSTYAGKDPIPTQAVIADEGAWPDLLTTVTDDTSITAANINAAPKGLADRTVWLARRQVNGLEGGEYDGELTFNDLHNPKANQYQYKTPVTFTPTVEGTPYRDVSTDPFWDIESTTFNWKTVGSDAAHAACRLCIPLHLPHGAALNGVVVRIKGPSGHAAFPGGKPKMPIVKVKSRDVATGVSTTLQSATDASATVGAYQAPHDIVCTLASPHFVDRSAEVLWIELTSEDDNSGAAGGSGDSALYGTYYYGSKVNYTVTIAASE